MRTKEEIENERYFGLQKFKSVVDALDVMSGTWGVSCEGIGQGELLILTDEKFKNAMMERALRRYIEYKLNMVDEAYMKRSLWIGDESNDYMMDFDFLLLSKIGKCYFTCRMTFCDDDVCGWNDRQWGYYEDLFDLYDIHSIIDAAINAVDDYFDEENITLEDGEKGTVEDVMDIMEGITQCAYETKDGESLTFIKSKTGMDAYVL